MEIYLQKEMLSSTAWYYLHKLYETLQEESVVTLIQFPLVL